MEATDINMGHQLALEGRGVLCLYMIYDNLHELHTSVEILPYVIYGIEYVLEYT